MQRISRELDQVLDRLDTQTATLLERTVCDAVALAQTRNQPVQATDALGYPAGYFDATAGSFEQEPLERPPQLPWETRETW